MSSVSRKYAKLSHNISCSRLQIIWTCQYTHSIIRTVSLRVCLTCLWRFFVLVFGHCSFHSIHSNDLYGVILCLTKRGCIDRTSCCSVSCGSDKSTYVFQIPSTSSEYCFILPATSEQILGVAYLTWSIVTEL
jgi:hypothetical protein